MRGMLLVLVFLLGFANAVDAQTNVAEGASVTGSGSFGTGGGPWGDPLVAPFSSVTDGVFVPDGQQWNVGTVWWNTTNNPASLLIDLGGLFDIFRFAVQADDNDSYLLEYRASSADPWLTAWVVPDFGPPGMQTRTFDLPATIAASELRFSAGTVGDEYRSVSEIQAFSRATSTVPEPMSMALLGTGLAALGALRSRRRRGSETV